MEKKEKKCHFGKNISAEIHRDFAVSDDAVCDFSLVCLAGSELGDEQELATRAHQSLAARELAAFEAFRFAQRRREWLTGRLAVKEAVRSWLRQGELPLTSLVVKTTEHGKPFMAPVHDEQRPHVAISHSAGLALGLASSAACSLDIQELRPALSRVAGRFVHPGEMALIGQCHADHLSGLGLLWAAKEALRKHLDMWPLLGFLECRLVGVAASGAGHLCHFAPEPSTRALAQNLPGVRVGWFRGLALAMVIEACHQ